MNKIVYDTQTGQILANPCDKQDAEIVASNYDNASWCITALDVYPIWEYRVNLDTLQVERAE